MLDIAGIFEPMLTIAFHWNSINSSEVSRHSTISFLLWQHWIYWGLMQSPDISGTAWISKSNFNCFSKNMMKLQVLPGFSEIPFKLHSYRQSFQHFPQIISISKWQEGNSSWLVYFVHFTLIYTTLNFIQDLIKIWKKTPPPLLYYISKNKITKVHGFLS